MGADFWIEDNKTDEIIEAMQDAALVALDAAGLQASSLAKRELQKSPSRIDTGLLRNSITHAVNSKPASINEYSADRASRYDGKVPEDGHYSGTAPPEDNEHIHDAFIGTNVEYAA